MTASTETHPVVIRSMRVTDEARGDAGSTEPELSHRGGVTITTEPARDPLETLNGFRGLSLVDTGRRCRDCLLGFALDDGHDLCPMCRTVETILGLPDDELHQRRMIRDLIVRRDDIEQLFHFYDSSALAPRWQGWAVEAWSVSFDALFPAGSTEDSASRYHPWWIPERSWSVGDGHIVPLPVLRFRVWRHAAPSRRKRMRSSSSSSS